jgi:hypothetical protein
MNTSEILSMAPLNQQLPESRLMELKEESAQEMPPAPRLRGQQSPVDLTPMSLPSSRD